MKKLILIRHGESEWNKLNLFTGWTDVDLSPKGLEEAYEAGKLLKKENYKPELCFTSYLKRAVKTLNNVLDAMDMDWLPVEKSWRLNEKSYGAIQGLNKADTAAKYGDDQVLIWRRSFDVQPPALEMNDPKSPRMDERYAELTDEQIPLTESLKDTAQVRRRLLNGLSLHRLPRNVTSCIMSQPSSASNAHFAAASPLCVKKLFSKSMFFIALAA